MATKSKRTRVRAAVAALRRRRDRKRVCRRCAGPRALKADGTLAKLCKKHLDEDRERRKK